MIPRFRDIPKSVTEDYGTTQVLNAGDEIRSTAEDLPAVELVPSDGGLIPDVGNLPIASPEPEPTPAP